MRAAILFYKKIYVSHVQARAPSSATPCWGKSNSGNTFFFFAKIGMLAIGHAVAFQN